MFITILARLVSFLNYLNVLIILPCLVLLVLSDVIVRSFFSSSIAWAHELSGLLLLSMFFLAIPKCIESGELLKVDLLYQHLSNFKRQLLRYLGYFSILFFSIVLIWQASLGVRDSLEYNDQAYTLELPFWPFYALMAFVGFVVACQSFCLIWQDRNYIKNGQISNDS